MPSIHSEAVAYHECSALFKLVWRRTWRHAQQTLMKLASFTIFLNLYRTTLLHHVVGVITSIFYTPYSGQHAVNLTKENHLCHLKIIFLMWVYLLSVIVRKVPLADGLFSSVGVALSYRLQIIKLTAKTI